MSVKILRNRHDAREAAKVFSVTFFLVFSNNSCSVGQNAPPTAGVSAHHWLEPPKFGALFAVSFVRLELLSRLNIATWKIISQNAHAPERLMPRSLLTLLYRNADANLRFYETVHTTPHKNLQSGYLDKRRFFSNAVDNDRTKTDICLNHNIVKGLKPQRHIFPPLL